MKDITTTPTAELLAEWGKLTAITSRPNYASVWNFDKSTVEGKIASIAAELDRRIKSAGMRTVRDYPVFSEFTMTIYAPNDKDAREATLSITIAELRDLLTWLIQKGGNDA